MFIIDSVAAVNICLLDHLEAAGVASIFADSENKGNACNTAPNKGKANITASLCYSLSFW